MTSPKQAVATEIQPGVLAVRISADYVTIIDAADFDLIQGYRWRPRVGYRDKVYIQTSIRHDSLYMHRLILDPGAGLDVDHINDNSLDNRRSNLRVATRSQNKANTRKPQRQNGRPPSSVFKGVCWDKSRQLWNSKICVAGRTRNLGRYAIEAEAALAYDSAALAAWGEFAWINFPGEAPR